MKKLILLLLISFVFISCDFSQNETSNKITINGKIVGTLPEFVNYTLPINGISYVHFKEQIQPDSTGAFSIEIPLQQAAIIEFYLPDYTNGALIAEPGMEYEVLFDMEKESEKFVINSENKSGQELYNNLPNRSLFDGHFQEEAQEYAKDPNVDEIKQQIETKKKRELADFKKLLDEDKISKSFYDLVKIDRDYFYAGAQASVGLIRYSMDQQQDATVLFTEEARALWKDVYEDYPITSKDLMRSVWGYYYLDTYGQLDYVLNPKNTDATFSHIEKVARTKQQLNGALEEYYFALYLYDAANRDNYEKELLSLYYDFKEKHPNSKYDELLKTEIVAIEDYHEKLATNDNKKINYISNAENIHSVAQLIDQLQHKKLYIDVWATWCKPCKEEFSKKEAIKDLLADNNVQTLYISIDQDNKAQQWEDMVKYYELEGLHLRASEALTKDLYRIYAANETLYIPWYMLTNTQGEIAVPHASKPSEKDQLSEELKRI